MEAEHRESSVLDLCDDRQAEGNRTPELAITLRSISEDLFWWFIEKQTHYVKYRIVEAEKALLDWAYITLQSAS